MTTAGEVKVKITGDMSDLSGALRQAGDQTQRASSRMSQSLAAVGRAAAVAALAIAAAVGAGVAASIREAANAGEIRDKFDAVFRDSADSAREWAHAFAEATGRSEIALEQYASTFQDTFVPLGFARSEAAGFSQTLTQLAIDLASFNNEAEPDTVRALQSALVGNHETVRRYGVILNQAGLEAELLTMGIAGGTEAATAQELAMARLNIIMAGTADAQGNATDTADSAANKWREFTSALRDAAIAIGEAFMPAALGLLEWLKETLPWIQRIGVAAGEMFSGFDRLFAADQFDPQNPREYAAEVSDLTTLIDDYHKSIFEGRSRIVSEGPLRSFLGQSGIAALMDETGGNLTDLAGQVATLEALEARMVELRLGVRNAVPTEGTATTENDPLVIDDDAARFANAATAAAKDWQEELARTNIELQAVKDNIIAAAEAANEKSKDMTEAFTGFTVSAESAAMSVTSAIGGLFDKMASGVRVTFRDLANEIMSIMARLAFNNLIANPLTTALTSVFSGGPIADAVGTTAAAVTSTAGAASFGKSGKSSQGQTIINIDARYATEGTAQMIESRLRAAAPGLVRSSVQASVNTMMQHNSARSAV